MSARWLAALALLLCSCAPHDPDSRAAEPDPACPDPGGIAYTAQQRPNVMLVVDRSDSMRQPGACAEGPCPSKWDQVRGMAGVYLDEVASASRLGLTLFPDVGESCEVGSRPTVLLDDGNHTGPLILDVFARTNPGGSTPLAEAIRSLDGLDDPGRDNIVVLLTDGEPRCECAGNSPECERREVVRAVGELVSRPVPVEVYVIGFGESAAAAAETLAAIADAAAPTTPPGNYFQVETVEDLLDKLRRLSASIAPCAFSLSEVVPAAELRVFVGDEELLPCADASCLEGYTYDEQNRRVTLAPLTCRTALGIECPEVRFERAP
jgi:hypothetical protein